MKTILLSAAIFAASAGSALSADAMAPGQAGFVWTGGYAGLQAGYGWGKSDADMRILGHTAGTFPLDPDGGLVGLYVGYNHQFANRFVLGAEGDIAYSRISGGPADIFDVSTGLTVPNNAATAELDWTGAIRLRAGYAFDRLLPYVTGGVAFGRYETVPDYDLTPPLPGSKAHIGWTIGAGVEYAVTDKVLARFDYRYADLGSGTYGIQGFPYFDTHVDLATHDVRFGVAYKF